MTAPSLLTLKTWSSRKPVGDQPTLTLEAAICGVPSIVSTVVPTAQILGEATEIVEADGLSALANSLDRLAREPARLAAMEQMAAQKAETQSKPADMVPLNRKATSR